MSSRLFLSGGTAKVIVFRRYTRSWVRRAVDWMVSKQRTDGGWGEDPTSYTDPSRAGEASVSMPALTGLVTSALIAAGEHRRATTKRAIEYLLRTQRTDGTWPENDWLAPSLPPRMFYRYPVTTRFYPLGALGRWLSLGA